MNLWLTRDRKTVCGTYTLFLCERKPVLGKAGAWHEADGSGGADYILDIQAEDMVGVGPKLGYGECRRVRVV